MDNNQNDASRFFEEALEEIMAEMGAEEIPGEELPLNGRAFVINDLSARDHKTTGGPCFCPDCVMGAVQRRAAEKAKMESGLAAMAGAANAAPRMGSTFSKPLTPHAALQDKIDGALLLAETQIRRLVFKELEETGRAIKRIVAEHLRGITQ